MQKLKPEQQKGHAWRRFKFAALWAPATSENCSPAVASPIECCLIRKRHVGR
uniref:Uncharacterized protein n=1 Tax=Peronospora matthiolae TaxID=2874970 RepID=A0AAV1V7M7_9STRA